MNTTKIKDTGGTIDVLTVGDSGVKRTAWFIKMAHAVEYRDAAEQNADLAWLIWKSSNLLDGYGKFKSSWDEFEGETLEDLRGDVEDRRDDLNKLLKDIDRLVEFREEQAEEEAEKASQ